MDIMEQSKCQHCSKSVLDTENTEWYKGKRYSIPALLREIEDIKEELERYQKAVEEGILIPCECKNEEEASPNLFLISALVVLAVAFAVIARIMLAR